MQLIRFTECLQLPILRTFRCRKRKLKSQYRVSAPGVSEWSSVLGPACCGAHSCSEQCLPHSHTYPRLKPPRCLFSYYFSEEVPGRALTLKQKRNHLII